MSKLGCTQSDRLVQQMHWGGGTPNYLSKEQLEFLWNTFHENFSFDPNAEISIEIKGASHFGNLVNMV